MAITLLLRWSVQSVPAMLADDFVIPYQGIKTKYLAFNTAECEYIVNT